MEDKEPKTYEEDDDDDKGKKKGKKKKIKNSKSVMKKM